MKDVPPASIPSSWIWSSIQEIATTATGGTPSRSIGAYFGGSIPWVKSGELGDGHVVETEETLSELGLESSNAKLFPKGTLCIALYGATVGKLGILEVDAATNQAVCGLFLADAVHRDFVFHYLASIRRNLIEQGKGGAQSNISNGLVRQTRIPIAPLNEQRRIVAKIEELFSDLDAGVAALERAKANLKRYRAAVLKAAVEGKLTEEWRARHPVKEPASALLERILKERRQKWETEQLARFAAADKQPPKNWREKYVEPSPPVTPGLPELPDGWCWATLGQLLHRIEGGKSFECLTRAAEPNEWGVVKVSAMTWGTFLEDEQKAIPPAAEFDPADEIKPNDLLLSRSNTTQLVGATVLVGNCRQRLLLSDKSLRLRATEIVNLHWLHTALSSSIARSQLSAMATGTSDSMRNVSQDKIKSVALPLPPIAEQQWVVDQAAVRQSQIDAAEMQIETGLLRASRLRQSILKQAFEGKLVPQDPTDEPASVLLERLRASQSVHEGNGRRRTSAPPHRSKSRGNKS